MQITVDCRTGIHNQDIVVTNAGLSDALSWLTRLDGNRHTLISLSRPTGHHLMIGGGPSWYVVTLDDGKNSLTLQNRHGAEAEIVELCAGGQYGEYPTAYCVDQMQAAQVINLFFEKTETNESWT